MSSSRSSTRKASTAQPCGWAFAENGLGIALLPLFCQIGAGNAARLVRVLPHVETETFPVQFLYPRQNLVPPTVRSFIELAIETQRDSWE